MVNGLQPAGQKKNDVETPYLVANKTERTIAQTEPLPPGQRDISILLFGIHLLKAI